MRPFRSFYSYLPTFDQGKFSGFNDLKDRDFLGVRQEREKGMFIFFEAKVIFARSTVEALRLSSSKHSFCIIKIKKNMTFDRYTTEQDLRLATVRCTRAIKSKLTLQCLLRRKTRLEL